MSGKLLVFHAVFMAGLLFYQVFSSCAKRGDSRAGSAEKQGRWENHLKNEVEQVQNDLVLILLSRLPESSWAALTGG